MIWRFEKYNNALDKKIEHKQVREQIEKNVYDLVQAMMQQMSQNNLEPQILVPINDQLQMMQEELDHKSFIIVGPAHSGKTAAVHWLTRKMHDHKNIIWIDCRYWQSDNAFIKQLLQEVSLVFRRQLKKPYVMKQGLSFKELNSQIQKEKVEIIIVIKNPQKLVEQGRPVLLYNIFQWMNYVHSSYLHLIIVSREIKFVDNQEKRVKSRMNAPILFCTRPRFNKIKEIINKRIEHCAQLYPQKQKQCFMLKKAMQQKELEGIINGQIEKKAVPISQYLKILQLILAIDIESEQKWSTLSQKQISSMICQGFEKYSVYIVDHRTIAKSFFSTSNVPELILMGLYRNRFLRQKQGNYTSPITLGQLMNDYNLKKSQVKIEEGGNSFLYSENVMQRALKNLIDWNLLTFSKISEKVALINREIDSRYGPQDIEYFYQEVQNMPNIVKQIYLDK